MAGMNPTLKKFRYIFFLLGLLWKILAGKKTGDGISFGGVMHGSKVGDKLLPYYYLYRSENHLGNNSDWLFLGYLHSSAKGWQFRKVLLKEWFALLFRRMILKLFISITIRGQSLLSFQNWQVQRKIHHLKKLKIHKKYVICLTDLPESLAGAKRCIGSAERYGEDKGMEIFPGVRKEDSQAFFLERDLTFTLTPDRDKTHDTKAEMGCFASHYLLWEKCVELDEPIMILEDDVEFCAPVLPLRFKEIIHLGQPISQRNQEIMAAVPNKYQETYYPFEHLLGTYAYAVSPLGAQKLIYAVRKNVVDVADRFIRSKTYDIVFYLPHPITTDVTNSSIRKTPHDI